MSYELLPNPGVKIAIFRDTRFPFGAFRTLEMRMPINFCAYNSCYLISLQVQFNHVSRHRVIV